MALVAADACLGLAATVCEDVRAKRPARVVHEFLIEPPQGGAEAPVSR